MKRNLEALDVETKTNRRRRRETPHAYLNG